MTIPRRLFHLRGFSLTPVTRHRPPPTAPPRIAATTSAPQTGNILIPPPARSQLYFYDADIRAYLRRPAFYEALLEIPHASIGRPDEQADTH